ncbi:MAG TPA: hypothetical protein VIL45_07070 [Thermoplasmata archaeon]
MGNIHVEPCYVRLAQLVQQRDNCIKSGNQLWLERCEERIPAIVEAFLPSGSGFDSGTRLDLDRSTADKLVFSTSFHHMNDGGMYDGWTEHEVIVTPSLAGEFNLRITGRNRNDIKDYMGELFDHSLRDLIDESESTAEVWTFRRVNRFKVAKTVAE